MKRIILFLWCLISALLISPSFAANVTVFGPHQYTRTQGAPDVFNNTFTAAPENALIIIENGNNNERHRVSSAEVVLNGKQIFGPNDFNQKTYLLSAPVTLNKKNLITIKLSSIPESYLTIKVIQQNVDPPTVNITSPQMMIEQGSSATLNWTSTNADTVTIAPDIGSVGRSGFVTVFPLNTTTYTITATGPGGTVEDSITIEVNIPPISLSITTPDNGDTLTKSYIMVQGTVISESGDETGVIINGIPAMIDNNRFVANHILLSEGENIITAVATDTEGNTNQTSITVHNGTPTGYISLTADTESGIAPLEVTLMVESSFNFTQSSLVDTGPGAVEIIESTDRTYKIRMTTQGLYSFTVEVTNGLGEIYTDTISILALDKAEMDALLRAKWEGMRQALTQGNIEDASDFFDSTTKNAYGAFFTANPELLDDMAQILNNIQFISMMKNSVEYDIRTIKDGKEYSFYLLFIKDENGLWKIKSF